MRANCVVDHSDRNNDSNDAGKLARYERLDPELLHPFSIDMSNNKSI